MINTGSYYLVYRYQYWDAQHHLVVSNTMATLECIRKGEGSAIIESARRVPQGSIDELGRFTGRVTPHN